MVTTHDGVFELIIFEKRIKGLQNSGIKPIKLFFGNGASSPAWREVDPARRFLKLATIRGLSGFGEQYKYPKRNLSLLIILWKFEGIYTFHHNLSIHIIEWDKYDDENNS